jgi:hypothetical protein
MIPTDRDAVTNVPSRLEQGRMPGSVRRTRFTDVTILTVARTATFPEVLTAIQVVSDEEPDGLFVWDLREAPSLVEVPPAALLQTVDSVLLPSRRAQGRGRSAYVVSRDADYALMCRLVAHAEEQGYRARLQVFRSDMDALNWVVGRGNG